MNCHYIQIEIVAEGLIYRSFFATTKETENEVSPLSKREMVNREIRRWADEELRMFELSNFSILQHPDFCGSKGFNY